MDITYDGTFFVTLETKVNLMKLRKSPTAETEAGPATQPATNVEGQDEDDELEADVSNREGGGESTKKRNFS